MICQDDEHHGAAVLTGISSIVSPAKLGDPNGMINVFARTSHFLKWINSEMVIIYNRITSVYFLMRKILFFSRRKLKFVLVKT